MPFLSSLESAHGFLSGVKISIHLAMMSLHSRSQQFLNGPDVVSDSGLHCRRDPERLMHSTKVIPRHEYGHCRFEVDQRLREGVGQPREPAKLHSQREVGPLTASTRQRLGIVINAGRLPVDTLLTSVENS